MFFHSSHSSMFWKVPWPPTQDRGCSTASSAQGDSHGLMLLRSHLLTHTQAKDHTSASCALENSPANQAAMRTCSPMHRRKFSNVNIRTHLLTHSGERVPQCQLCTLAFSLRGGLMAHMTIHICHKQQQYPSFLERLSQIVYHPHRWKASSMPVLLKAMCQAWCFEDTHALPYNLRQGVGIARECADAGKCLQFFFY